MPRVIITNVVKTKKGWTIVDSVDETGETKKSFLNQSQAEESGISEGMKSNLFSDEPEVSLLQGFYDSRGNLVKVEQE